MYTSQEQFEKALYNSASIPDFLDLYSSLLLERDDDLSIAHAHRLMLYKREIINKKYLKELRDDFNSIYDLIVKTEPETRFSIEGRRKAAVSTDKKIIRALREPKSLDSIRDTAAFRIILFGPETEELQNKCYSIMNSLISFNQRKGYTLCKSNQPINMISISENPNIIIPKKSLVHPYFLYGVKDYILHPKENGYQSLHAIFRTKNGDCFEVQIRTLTQHTHAETGNACHKVYKNEKYSSSELTFNRSKVHIPGYAISENGEIFDCIGLEKSLEILKRQRTF